MTADAVIIGAGPAGLAAAIELRRLGIAGVVVLEREEVAGGIPRHSAHTGFGMRDLHRLLSGPTYAARYVRQARDAGVEIRTATTVTGWSGPTSVATTSPTGLAEIDARCVLLATGCRERPRAARLVPGSRPMGVLTTGALQQLVHLHRAPIGRRAVVVGAEHVSFSAVLTLVHAGATVTAMLTEHARHQSYAPFKWLTATRFGVPIRTETALTRILGQRRVEAVEVTELRSGASEQIPCDTVVFTGDWIPDHELARRRDLRMDGGTRAPQIDQALRTSAPGVFAAGNLLHGAETADVAALSGRHAARAMHAFLTTGAWNAQPPLALQCEPPLRWISPSAVTGATPPPHGHFLLRVDEYRGPACLVIAQDGRTVWRQRYRRLIPNLPIHLSAAWLNDLVPSGRPVSIRVEAA